MKIAYLVRTSAAALLVLAGVSCSDSRPRLQRVTLEEPTEFPRADPATPSERRWHDAVLEQDLVLGSPSDPLLLPIRVREAENGNVLVLDFGAQEVREYTSRGEPVRRYGRGRGRGPGEFLNATDFGITEDEIWVLDSAQGRIAVFDYRGEPTRTIPLDGPALRMDVAPDGRFTLLSLMGHLFEDYGADGRLVRSYGQLVPDQARKGIALQGEMVRDEALGLVYAPLRAGYLARFAPGGELAFYRETVTRLPYPRTSTRSDGAFHIVEDDREQLSTRSVALLADTIFVLTHGETPRGKHWILDAYDARNGDYRYSTVVPGGSIHSITVTPRYLYTVSDTAVVRWQRKAR